MKTGQYDLLRSNVGQKKPPRLGSTVCYGQTWARNSHQNLAVRFVTAKSWPHQDSAVLSQKNHHDSAVRFVTAETRPENAGRASWPEVATKTRQYDLLRPNVGQKKPPRLICYGQQQESPRPGSTVVATKNWPKGATKTRPYNLLRPRVGSAVRFVTAKSWPEGATKSRQYDLLRPNVGQKEPPRLGSTICYGQTWARKSHQDSPPRPGSTICYDQKLTRRSHQDWAVRFVTAKSWPEKATKTRQHDLLRPNLGQKEPPRLGSTICYGQTWVAQNVALTALGTQASEWCMGHTKGTLSPLYSFAKPK